MRSIIAFAIGALIIAGVLPRLYISGARMPTTASATTAAPAEPAAQAMAAYYGSRTVTIDADRRGHFQAQGSIDGRPMDFLVDTGASVIALRESDAGRLGFHPGQRDYTAQVRTANGTLQAAPIELNRVEIGGLAVHNVSALVLPDEALSENLLGVSFLSRLRRYEYANGRLVLEQ
jgi:aspartyl protease family protein